MFHYGLLKNRIQKSRGEFYSGGLALELDRLIPTSLMDPPICRKYTVS